MRAAQYIEPGVLRLADVAESQPGPGQLVVEVDVCGICGSDLHAFRHGYLMRPGQVLGHELVGRARDDDAATGLRAGARVCVRPLIPCRGCPRCLAGEPELCQGGYRDQIGFAVAGGFAEQVLVPRAAVGETVFALPDEVTDDQAALVEPLAVALHAVRLAAPVIGETAVVFGLGTIGLGVVAMLRRAGVGTIVAFDPSALRRDRALDLGADLAHDPLETDPVGAVQAVTGRAPHRGAAADLAIDCAGVEASFAAMLPALRNGGRAVIAALYAGPVPFDPSRIVERGLTLRGSIGYRDEFPRVIELLRAGEVDAEGLISHRFPLDRVQEAFETQLDPARSLKVLVEP